MKPKPISNFLIFFNIIEFGKRTDILILFLPSLPSQYTITIHS